MRAALYIPKLSAEWYCRKRLMWCASLSQNQALPVPRDVELIAPLCLFVAQHRLVILRDNGDSTVVTKSVWRPESVPKSRVTTTHPLFS